MTDLRRLAPVALLVLALVATGCGGDGGGTEAAAPQHPGQGAERQAAAPQPASSAPAREARRKEAAAGSRRRARKAARRRAAARRVLPERVLRRAKSPTARNVETPDGALVVGGRPENAPKPAAPAPVVAPEDRQEPPARSDGDGAAPGGQDAAGDSGFLG